MKNYMDSYLPTQSSKSLTLFHLIINIVSVTLCCVSLITYNTFKRKLIIDYTIIYKYILKVTILKYLPLLSPTLVRSKTYA